MKKISLTEAIELEYISEDGLDENGESVSEVWSDNWMPGSRLEELYLYFCGHEGDVKVVAEDGSYAYLDPQGFYHSAHCIANGFEAIESNNDFDEEDSKLLSEALALI